MARSPVRLPSLRIVVKPDTARNDERRTDEWAKDRDPNERIWTLERGVVQDPRKARRLQARRVVRVQFGGGGTSKSGQKIRVRGGRWRPRTLLHGADATRRVVPRAVLPRRGAMRRKPVRRYSRNKYIVSCDGRSGARWGKHHGPEGATWVNRGSPKIEAEKKLDGDIVVLRRATKLGAHAHRTATLAKDKGEGGVGRTIRLTDGDA